MKELDHRIINSIKSTYRIGNSVLSITQDWLIATCKDSTELDAVGSKIKSERGYNYDRSPSRQHYEDYNDNDDRRTTKATA